MFLFSPFQNKNMESKQGKLIQSLSLTSAIVFVISSVIGSGVYKKAAPMSDALGSPDLVLLAWVLAGVISLFGALSNAEIAGMMADSGGEYVYLKRIYGKFTAFIFGWSIFSVIKSGAVAGLAYVFAQSVNSFFPLPHLPESIEQISIFNAIKPFENFGVKSLAIGLILFLTYYNSRGLKGGELLSGWITRLVVIGLGFIVVSGLIWGGGSLANVSTPATTFVAKSWTDFTFIKALFAALLSAFWAYEGWNTVGFIGGEIKNPNKNLPLALFGGMAIIIIVYILVNFTYHYVLPIDNLIDVYQKKNDIAAISVVRHFAGDSGALILSLLILITTLGCTNSTLLMPPRMFYSMAKDGLFFDKCADIHPTAHVPSNAIRYFGLWSCVLVLSGSFDQLTDMLIFAAFFFYGATALGVIVLRKKEPDTPRPYRVWGYPFVPAIFILFCFSLVVITCFNKPREALFGTILMMTGLPFYYYWTSKNKKQLNS